MLFLCTRSRPGELELRPPPSRGDKHQSPAKPHRSRRKLALPRRYYLANPTSTLQRYRARTSGTRSLAPRVPRALPISSRPPQHRRHLSPPHPVGPPSTSPSHHSAHTYPRRLLSGQSDTAPGSAQAADPRSTVLNPSARCRHNVDNVARAVAHLLQLLVVCSRHSPEHHVVARWHALRAPVQALLRHRPLPLHVGQGQRPGDRR